MEYKINLSIFIGNMKLRTKKGVKSMSLRTEKYLNVISLTMVILMMLLIVSVSPIISFAASETITNGTITVTVDTTFPQPLQYQLNSSGAILYGGDVNQAHNIYVNGTAYSTSVTTYTKYADYALYTVSVPGFNISIDYRFELSGNALGAPSMGAI